MIDAIAGLLTSVDVLHKLVASTIDKARRVEALDLLLTIKTGMVAAQDRILALQQEVAESEQRVRTAESRTAALEGEVRDLQRQIDDRGRHVPTAIPGGGIAYVREGLQGPDGQPVYFCPGCTDQGKPSMLQPVPQGLAKQAYRCPACGTEYGPAHPVGKAESIRRVSRYDGNW